jgi:hypothetical protein
MTHRSRLAEQFPPSPPCACGVCVDYCARPGWWTVAEAKRALDAGLGPRMMLELSPDRRTGVLSPAFRGNEGMYALNDHAHKGCNFLTPDRRCELFGSGVQPLECRFCHHERRGDGPKCHRALEKDWNSHAGRRLVAQWATQRGLAWPVRGS